MARRRPWRPAGGRTAPPGCAASRGRPRRSRGTCAPLALGAKEAGAEAVGAQACRQGHVVDRRRAHRLEAAAASQASRRRRMNWPLATGGPAPAAAAPVGKEAVEQGEDGGDQQVLAGAADLLEAGQETASSPARPPRRAPAPAGREHGGCRRRSTAARGSPPLARRPRGRGPSPASRRGGDRRRAASAGAPPPPARRPARRCRRSSRRRSPAPGGRRSAPAGSPRTPRR